MLSPSSTAARYSAISGAMNEIAMPSASGVRTTPQKNDAASPACSAPRSACSRSTGRAGKRPPLSRQTGASTSVAITQRTNSAVYTPLASEARFISASIIENSAMPSTVIAIGTSRCVGRGAGRRVATVIAGP